MATRSVTWRASWRSWARRGCGLSRDAGAVHRRSSAIAALAGRGGADPCSSAAILAANARDMEAARARNLSAALLDRLQLNESRVEAMARGIEEIVALADPVGTVIAEWTRPNGLVIQRVRVPLGVIGIIYESRPERDGRRGRAVPEVGQSGHPARRLGKPA